MKGLKGAIVMLATLGLMLVPVRSQAFFDGFNGVACNPPGSPPCINFNNWHGDDTSESGVSSTEIARGIKNGQLQLALRTFGSTASDAGTRAGRNRLGLNNPTDLTILFVQVSINVAVAEACGANPTASLTRAVLHGKFFNDGSSAGANDQTGDVFAEMRMTQDSTGTMGFSLAVLRCGDQDCTRPNITTVLPVHDFVKAWALNQGHSLAVAWDKVNNKFTGVVDLGANQESFTTGAYALSDSAEPVKDEKDVRVQNVSANCTAGSKQGGMDARFDNFFAQ
jgi:hypothetical protein